jgi:excisionase family DNA binding protein
VNNPPVTTAYAAKALGVHTATIRRMVERGELTPALKAPGLRGAYLFDPADIIRLASQRAKAAA